MSEFQVDGQNNTVHFQSKVTHEVLGEGLVVGFVMGEVCPVQRERLAIVRFGEPEEEVTAQLTGRTLYVTDSLIPVEETVLNVFCYGSRLYGTATNESDTDFIILVEDREGQADFPLQVQREDGTLDLTIHNQTSFQRGLDEHEISVMEAYCGEGKHGSTLPWISHSILRSSISEAASHAWVKGKKKLTVEKDYDPYAGKKSIFHAIRILMFGTYLANHGTIRFYEANRYWDVIKDLPDDWDTIHKMMKPIYNEVSSKFKKAAPKDGKTHIFK